MIQLEFNHPIATLTLDRPEKHNAFNAELINELLKAFDKVSQSHARVLVLRSSGKHFCAGGDLEWMQQEIHSTPEDNFNNARHLAELFSRCYSLPIPTIAKVQGWAFGGGAGLLCCCDIVMASENARFCFSEVKLGLAPATIAPYVMRKIGPSLANYLFLTASSLEAKAAQDIGLVTQVLLDHELEKALNKTIEQILSNGPQAIQACKSLIRDLNPITPDQIEMTIQLIATLRTSEEGQEGLKAFLEKRKPNWAL